MGWQQIMKLGHLHSSLIGIVRDSIKTASTAALPGVCLLCKLVFRYRHADTSMSTVLRLCISGRNAMVYLVHQWWPGRPATKRRGQNNLKVSIDDGYRLHFLVPGDHIGSPILHVKHHA